eukprot:4446519-Prymnesium_polylepis.1
MVLVERVEQLVAEPVVLCCWRFHCSKDLQGVSGLAGELQQHAPAVDRLHFVWRERFVKRNLCLQCCQKGWLCRLAKGCLRFFLVVLK